MVTGAGTFFDGMTSTRHDVTVEAAPERLRVRAADGALLAEWAYDELQALPAPESVLRLGRHDSPILARLEIRDVALAAAVKQLAVTLDPTGAAERRSRVKVVGWTLAACVSIVLVAFFGLPAIVDRAAPLIPMSVERHLGNAVDAQVRSMLDTSTRSGKPFECGTAESEKAGRAALEKMIGGLERAADLPIPLKTIVVRRKEANAIALPGGHIYVFQGLVDKSNNPDELAGVIAHEIGHVANRDGTRSILQAAGVSLLFGILLGDFTGGGLVVMAARQIVQSSYSRDVEAGADLFSVRLMNKIGADARALGTILGRIAGEDLPVISIILDHPQTKDRAAAIEAAAGSARAAKPVLAPEEWTALKGICG